MKRPLAFVYVTGLFLLGIVIGALGMHLVHLQPIDGRRPPVPWGQGDRSGAGMHFERVAERLELTDEQREQIREILADSRHHAHGLHEEMLPRVSELVDQTRERIDGVLTPEQRDCLEEMTSQHRGGLERLFLGHGPGDHRPRRGRGPSRGGPGRE